MKSHINDVDLPAMASALQRALGTYFNALSGDREFYRALCNAVVFSFEDAWKLAYQYNNLAFIENTLLQNILPPKKLVLKVSERQKTTTGYFWFELPEVIYFDSLSVSMFETGVVLFRGIDFQLEPWGEGLRILFSLDILATNESELFVELDENNVEVDRFLELRIIEPKIADSPIAKNWGWLLNYPTVTNEDQRKALFSLKDCLTHGCNLENMTIGLGRAFGNPVCEVHNEVVKYLLVYPTEQLVITDQSVYHYPTTVTINVAVGDKLKKCQQISSAIKWYNINKPGDVDLPSLAISQSELGPDYHSDIIFPNQLLPTTVSTQANYTKLTVPLYGDALSVETYWNDVHTRGIAAGMTLAQSLDSRANPTTEPEAMHLPTDMNPMVELLLENLFRFNVILLSVDTNQVNSVSGFEFLNALQKLIPGHQMLKTIVKHEVLGGTYPGPVGGVPEFGVVFQGDDGYYGLGVGTSFGGNPTIGVWA